LGPDEIEIMRSLEGAAFQNQDSSDGPPRSDQREQELEGWLERRGLSESWAMAPPLSDAGWDRESLATLLEPADEAHVEAILRWAASGAEAQGLVTEIQRGSKAISAIVGSVRSYSKLDRGPIQMVDVAESISDTLVILKGKLTDQVTVVEDIPPELPRIEAYGGELNQVWTNLIDNALDAMGGSGTLEIRARATEEGIIVKVVDDGPGIPEKVRPSIFDPFFTTKPQGRGTGLGLAITYGIVVNRHRGTIEVDSRPGRTVFEVALPRRMKRE
jgi:signal transduction histidine kinase